MREDVRKKGCELRGYLMIALPASSAGLRPQTTR